MNVYRFWGARYGMRRYENLLGPQWPRLGVYDVLHGIVTGHCAIGSIQYSADFGLFFRANHRFG